MRLSQSSAARQGEKSRNIEDPKTKRKSAKYFRRSAAENININKAEDNARSKPFVWRNQISSAQSAATNTMYSFVGFSLKSNRK